MSTFLGMCYKCRQVPGASRGCCSKSWHSLIFEETQRTQTQRLSVHVIANASQSPPAIANSFFFSAEGVNTLNVFIRTWSEVCVYTCSDFQDNTTFNPWDHRFHSYFVDQHLMVLMRMLCLSDYWWVTRETTEGKVFNDLHSIEKRFLKWARQ